MNISRDMLKKMLISSLIVVFISIIYGGYLGYKAYNATQASYKGLEREHSQLRSDEIKVSDDSFSVVLMGIEEYSTKGKNGRTDTLIVVTFNPEKKTIKMLSIPRDTRAKIVGKGTIEKVNHAYAYGGTDMSIDTVEGLLGIPIDYYMTVNFDGFRNIIDELGGITVEVPFDFYEKNYPTNELINFTKGKMHLNGDEALAYVRMRKLDPLGDIGRNQRQKQVIRASIDRMKNPISILKIDDIIDHLGNNIKTNLSTKDLLELKDRYEHINTSDIETVDLTGENKTIDGLDYFIPNQESISDVQQELKQHLNIK
jgi:polyisoprenyl-teichoic acid--peptidoglycan teichoic acid transferase